MSRVVLCSSLLAVAALSAAAGASERITLNFNPDWKFIKDDPAGASEVKLIDAQWASVSAPHTYNDVDTFDDWSLPGHRGEQNQWGGRTWYRKTFTAPEAWKGKKVYIEFEGVRQVAEIYLNGKLLGTCKTGFTPFGFDLTPNLKTGGENVLAVMCDNRFMKDPNDAKSIEASNKSGKDSSKKDVGPGGGLAELSAKVNEKIPENLDDLKADQIPWNNPHWHPAHGGIYRNVRLIVTDPLHISLPLYSFLQTEGPYVYATDVSDKSAKIGIEIPVQNGRSGAEKIEVTADVVDQSGKSVLSLKQDEQAAPGGNSTVKLAGELKDPQLWEPDYPYLYKVVCTLKAGGQAVDACELPLGVRSVKWDKDHGFSINGHHVKLHGWGQKPTDEWPGLGAAQPDWLHFYTLKLMKDAGGNFVRWGHSAAGPAQIDSGDRLGIVFDQPGVDGESDTRAAAWKLRSMAFRDTLIYFRNNPSILIWEGGNQKVTKDHAKELHDYVLKYDPHGSRAYAHRRADKVDAEFMDIGIGTEGGQEIKELPVVEGEYDREESPRRVWDDKSPPNFGYPEAKGQTYDLTGEQYAVNQVKQYVDKLGAESHSGGANWIFSDSTSGGRVACEVARASGEVDGVRLPKEAYYVCRVMYSDEPMVHIIGHWTYPADTKKDVYVVSNCDEVELFVNGKSVGKDKPTNKYLFKFPNVAYKPGDIKAVTHKGGKEYSQTKRTAGEAVALRITPITAPSGLRADGSDIALFDVEAIDKDNERCPTFQQRVDFELDGPAVWRGGYNSGKINSINNQYLDLECGINRVAIRSTRQPGEITVRAKSAGLQPTIAKISSVPIKVESGGSTTLPILPTVAISKNRGNLAMTDVSSKSADAEKSAVHRGKYLKSIQYTGPTKEVHIEGDAKANKKIYLDREDKFSALPKSLQKADWIQAAHADRLYNAVDLIEVPAPAGTVVYVAHDDRLDRPKWLTNGFQPTDMSLKVEGQAMKVFEHKVDKEESLTLGTNTENPKADASNMYIVFVNAAPK